MGEQLESPYFDHELFETEGPVSSGPYIVVELSKDRLVTAGEYAIHQGKVVVRGGFNDKLPGRAYLGAIDVAQSFIFEVRDRVCAIRAGAYFNPGDRDLQYGGTQFDWSLVRDDHQAEKNFWPYYQREMDLASTLEEHEATVDRRVERFLQHEHITRRPIRVATPFRSQLQNVRIRATAPRIRVGPFVRYTDYERAVIWLETVTPCIVRVRYRKSGTVAEASGYAPTVRVGGRHYAAVEIARLDPHAFYDYTVELAPTPVSTPIPDKEPDLARVFPTLTLPVAVAMKQQCAAASLTNTEWLTFRTLQPKYAKLRFATGSCRWYPEDKDRNKSWGPDMLLGLGDWLYLKAKEKAEWPEFLFFGGDQIYADEIGDNHADMIVNGRFASRVPGPADTSSSLPARLIDGAWAGRFAHRFLAYKEWPANQIENIERALHKLDDIHQRYPDIQLISQQYPGEDPVEKLKWRYRLFRTKRGSAKLEADDERAVRQALDLLPIVKTLETSSEPFRALVPHWRAGFGIALRRNPMVGRYLVHNFLLWKIPPFPNQLPKLVQGGGATVMKTPDDRGHPSAAGGVHAADFAEYAYLHERAWTGAASVRRLLAHIPTFLMFDDHEATDDWNADATWARMLQNPKDDFRMWPKTLTDALAAYWVYQGWCNKAPSQWKSDPRAEALVNAARDGTDALPQLRRIIHDACFVLKSERGGVRAGMSLDWHYKLPFDPPFLVPDCRTRRLMVSSDESLQEIDHEVPSKSPKSATIDERQLEWLDSELRRWRGSVAFIATSTPLLLQKKVATFMRRPQLAAGASLRGPDVASFLAALFESKKLLVASSTMLDRLFRLTSDLEHMIRDRTWSDLWKLVESLRAGASPLKTIVFVSGDVHHSYAMTANLPGAGRPKPELLQITCSGLQTTIRADFQKRLAEKISTSPFSVGRYRQVPGFMSKGGTGAPDLILYENAVAMVDVTVAAEVDVTVNYLAGRNTHVFKYTSGPAYMLDGVPAIFQRHRQRGPAMATVSGI